MKTTHFFLYAFLSIFAAARALAADPLLLEGFDGASRVKIEDGDFSTSSSATDFGNVFDGSSLTKTYIVTNTGGSAVVLENILSSNSSFTIKSQTEIPVSLASGNELEFTISFAAGTTLATSQIDVSIDTGSVCSFGVQGRGIALEESPFELRGQPSGGSFEIRIFDGTGTASVNAGTDFGVANNLVAPPISNFRITNPSFSEPFTVTSISIGSSAFTITPDSPLPHTLTPGGDLEFDVEFSATVPGTFNRELTINSTAGFEPFVCSVKAVYQIIPEFAVFSSLGLLVESGAPTSTTNLTDFGSVLQGSHGDRTFRVRNSSGADVNVTSASSDSPSIFSILSAPSVIPPGEEADLVIRYSPDDLGADSATIRIDHIGGAAIESPFFLNVSGSGVIEIPTFTLTTSRLVPIPNGAAADDSLGTLFPAGENFEFTNRTFRIRNTGQLDLEISGFQIDGPFEFLLFPPELVEAGEDYYFQIGGVINNGDKDGIVRMSTNAGLFSFQLRGAEDGEGGGSVLEPRNLDVRGVNGGAITSSSGPAVSTGTDFGLVELGTTKTQTFRLVNPNAFDIQILSIELIESGPGPGGGFSIISEPSVIPGGGQAELRVAFSSTTVITNDITLRIETDVFSSSNVSSLRLRGKGFRFATQIRVETQAGDLIPNGGDSPFTNFGNTESDSLGFHVRYLRVRNIGFSTVSISDISAPEGFLLFSFDGTSLAPGEVLQLELEFAPQNTESRKYEGDAVLITSDGVYSFGVSGSYNAYVPEIIKVERLGNNVELTFEADRPFGAFRVRQSGDLSSWVDFAGQTYPNSLSGIHTLLVTGGGIPTASGKRFFQIAR